MTIAKSDRMLLQEKIHAEIDVWAAEADKVRANLKSASADAQLELNQKLRSLDTNLEHGKTKLDEIGDIAEDKWEDVKDSFRKGWEDLKFEARKFIDDVID